MATNEVALLANLWESLELRLVARLDVTVSVSKMFFLMRFGDVALDEDSSVAEVL